MKFSRIILPSMLIAGALAVGSIGVDRVLAQNSDTNYPSIVLKLSEKFNLDKDAVLEVFTEEHAEKQAQMLQLFEDRLDDAVGEGKITVDQKALILDKHEEMQAKMDELRSQNLSRDQMHEEMKKLHDELKTWATQNGINIPFAMQRGHGFGDGFKMGVKTMEKNN